jgi:hypothetical protein
MNYVFQDNIFTEPWFDGMIDFLTRMELPYEIVKAVPFSGEIIPKPKAPKKNTVFFGSYSFTNKAIELGYTPGSWTNDNYDYRVWSKKWPCVNDDAYVCKFGEVPFQSKPFFIRPCADDKLFSGQVMDWGDFSEWQKKVIELKETYTTLDYDSPVMVSSPKKIQEEYRFVIIDGKPVTGSMYKSGNTVLYREVTESKNPQVFHFVHYLMQPHMFWQPSFAYALDIALVDGDYAVMEMGNVNSAGLYDCDPQKIVMALENHFG